MKTHHLLLLACSITGTAMAQSWNMGLSAPASAGESALGTSNNYPLNFFTNGTQRMSLGTDGLLSLDELSATGKITSSGGFMFSGQDGLRFDPANNILIFGRGSTFLPPPVDGCSSLPSPTTTGWFGADGLVSAQVNPTIAPNVNAALRLYIAPTSGHGYLELNGTDYNSTTNNALFINYNCGRSTQINTGTNAGIVRIGSSNANSRVYIGNYINMNRHVEIGDPANGITSSPANVALDIHTHSGTGLRFRTSVDNIPLILIQDSSNNNLKQSFKVLGDGATEIKTDNPDAFVVGYSQGPQNLKIHADGNIDMAPQAGNAITIKNAANGLVKFNVGTSGYTEIKTAGSAFSIKNSANSNAETFAVNSDGYTQIKSAVPKALSVYNGTQETFMVNKNGYAEIRVYSPSGMPTLYGSSNPRVLTIRDSSNSRDLLVVRADGKMYAREVEISNVSNFPDYVFAKDYKLMPLNQVETFIKQHQHLPGFAKGIEYEQKGVNVNELLLKQQEKIEELTLYVIGLEKRLNELQSKSNH